ncbi:Laminin subunit alpha1like, partial [Caligus rogercresseyi]
GPDGLYLSVNEIPAPLTGGLFVGGLPGHLRSKASEMSKSLNGFNGLLKDIVFIDDLSVRVVSMTNPVSFSNAGIGRDNRYNKPAADSLIFSSSVTIMRHSLHHHHQSTATTLQMQDQEKVSEFSSDHRRRKEPRPGACSKSAGEGSMLEEGAFGFGGLEGFVRKSSTLHSPKRLEISLEFRSSQSNGVLFAFK